MIFLSFPANISRYHKTYKFKIGTETTKAYLYSSRTFTKYNKQFDDSVFVSLVIRDLLPLIGIVVLVIVYLRTITSFYKLRKSLKDKMTSSNKNLTTFRRSDLEYARVLIILAVTTASSFVIVISLRFFLEINIQDNFSFITGLLQMNGFITSLRNSLNFIIFYRLNLKFRKKLKKHLPRYLRSKVEPTFTDQTASSQK